MSELGGARLRLRERLTSGALSDALDGDGIWSVLHPSIRQRGGARRPFFGKAYTVCWGPTRKRQDIRQPMPATWTEVRDFLLPVGLDVEGHVYVAGSQSGLIDRFALAGGLSTAHFERLGMEAVVLGGAVRDADELERGNIPVWASAFSPADSQGNFRVVSTGTECIVDGVLIRTGDWIFGDATGVVAIPAAQAEHVIQRALEILDVEASIQEKCRAGASLLSVLDEFGHI